MVVMCCSVQGAGYPTDSCRSVRKQGLAHDRMFQKETGHRPDESPLVG